MKFRYYFTAIQCNRFCCNFIKSCDLGIDGYGKTVSISFITDLEPNKQNIEKLEKLLEKSEEETSLEEYFSMVKFEKAEVIIEENKEGK